MTGKPPDEKAAEITVFAKAEGYEFTQAEWLDYRKARELGDGDLEAVAGGFLF